MEATFLFADLAGFTALTEAHGDEAAADLAARFYALAEASLGTGARVVKRMGDAVMIVAGDPAEAVATALQLYRAVEREPMFPMIRVGIHVGPAEERDGDFFGMTVNLAARVAAYARSGQVLCTEKIIDAARNAEKVAVYPLGPAQLKNVPQPVLLFEIVGEGDSTSCMKVDPVCRMLVERETAPAKLPFGDQIYYFCSFPCAQRFALSPDVYLRT
ncbi:MAG: YHS domain-containing protein [Deltaproteobacteria bacterium]|nr:YHS domain-containing protein [Deltaproteobacteria bacterium]